MVVQSCNSWAISERVTYEVTEEAVKNPTCHASQISQLKWYFITQQYRVKKWTHINLISPLHWFESSDAWAVCNAIVWVMVSSTFFKTYSFTSLPRELKWAQSPFQWNVLCSEMITVTYEVMKEDRKKSGFFSYCILIWKTNVCIKESRKRCHMRFNLYNI